MVYVFSFVFLTDGFHKKTANYPHFGDKGGGSLNMDKRWGGGGSPHVDKKNS